MILMDILFCICRRSLPFACTFQKQPPEVFYKKRCSQKFPKIHRKTPVPESFFLIVAKNVTLLKKETLVQKFFCEFCEISQTAFFTKHLWTTPSDIYKNLFRMPDLMISRKNLMLQWVQSQHLLNCSCLVIR